MTQSDYFRLATTVTLVMGIIYANILLFNGISWGNRDNKITMRGYNDRIVFDCFNDPFPNKCGISALNLPPVTIDDSPHPKKTSHYTSGPLLATIYVASKNSVGTLTSPCESPTLHFFGSKTPATDHNMMKDEKFCETRQRGYCDRRHDGIRCYKNPGYSASHLLIIIWFITVIDLTKNQI